MTTEVKEEQPVAAAAQGANGQPAEAEAFEEKVEAATNGATNGSANGSAAHDEADNDDKNGHESKHNESISELAASVKQRQRKKVERFLPTAPISEDRGKEFSIPQGKGIKLGDLDNVEFRISRTEVEDLKPLHRVLFGTTGKALTVRKNLRAFTGFDFEKSTPQYEKKMEQIRRFTVKGMKFVLQLLDLETKGDREELEMRLMDFLMNPQPSGRKSLKEAAKEASEKKKKSSERKKAAAEKKRIKAEKKKSASDKKKSKSPAKKANGEGKGKKRPAPADSGSDDSSESGTESESESGSESDSSASSEGSVSKESSSPSPSPAKKAKSAAQKTPIKSPAKKAAKVAKSPEKASSGEPSDEELHDIISDFVSNADLETVTMKTVIAHVFSKFPSMDLSSRKPWIKETVKELVAAAP